MAPKDKRKRANALRLDDPRWIRVRKALHIGSEQQTSHLASLDLMEALRSENVRCMRRSMTNQSERELVPASFWEGLQIYDSNGSIQFHRAAPIQETPRDLREINAWTHFVWKPDIDKLWPSTAADQTLTETSVHRRPGKTPKYDWPLNVAREVIRRIVSGEKHPTAPAMIRHCKETIRYEPDDSDMRKLLKFLRGN